MRTALFASTIALAGLCANAVHGMPVVRPDDGASNIIRVSGGCGPAFHRNYYGACVPNGPGWGGVVVAPGFYGGGYRGGYYRAGGWHGGYYRGGYYHGGGWHGGHAGWHGGYHGGVYRR